MAVHIYTPAQVTVPAHSEDHIWVVGGKDLVVADEDVGGIVGNPCLVGKKDGPPYVRLGLPVIHAPKHGRPADMLGCERAAQPVEDLRLGHQRIAEALGAAEERTHHLLGDCHPLHRIEELLTHGAALARKRRIHHLGARLCRRILNGRVDGECRAAGRAVEADHLHHVEARNCRLRQGAQQREQDDRRDTLHEPLPAFGCDTMGCALAHEPPGAALPARAALLVASADPPAQRCSGLWCGARSRRRWAAR